MSTETKQGCESGAVNEPSVSVIVPVFNGASTIAGCIESLLAVDYPRDRFELLIVDNCSTDATRSILARYPVRVVEEREVQSSYAARNRGADASRSEYLVFTDADCIVERGWLRALVRALQPPEVGGVAGGIEAFPGESAVERYQAPRAIRAERAFAHQFLPFAQTANAAFKRTVFSKIGGFDPAIIYGGDLDFSWRMQRETGLRLVFEPTAIVRHRHRTTHRGLFRLYEKNAIAYCLLAQHHEQYLSFPEFRTFLYLIREAARNGAKALGKALRFGREETLTSYFDALSFAGSAWGWFRWHRGTAIPRTFGSGHAQKAH